MEQKSFGPCTDSSLSLGWIYEGHEHKFPLRIHHGSRLIVVCAAEILEVQHRARQNQLINSSLDFEFSRELAGHWFTHVFFPPGSGQEAAERLVSFLSRQAPGPLQQQVLALPSARWRLTLSEHSKLFVMSEHGQSSLFSHFWFGSLGYCGCQKMFSLNNYMWNNFNCRCCWNCICKWLTYGMIEQISVEALSNKMSVIIPEDHNKFLFYFQ